LSTTLSASPVIAAAVLALFQQCSVLGPEFA